MRAAEATRLPTQTVKNRATKTRKVLSAMWKARWATVGALLVAALALLLVLRRPREEARLPHPVPPPRPVPTAPPEIPVSVRAARLREEAAIECKREFYWVCQDKLDQAKRLDPGGEGLPAVRELRHTIEDKGRPDDFLDSKSTHHR